MNRINSIGVDVGVADSASVGVGIRVETGICVGTAVGTTVAVGVHVAVADGNGVTVGRSVGETLAVGVARASVGTEVLVGSIFTTAATGTNVGEGMLSIPRQPAINPTDIRPDTTNTTPRNRLDLTPASSRRK